MKETVSVRAGPPLATEGFQNKTTPETWEALKKAADYREFLKAYLNHRQISMAQLALAAGFNRGFIGDVLSARRRLKPDSVYNLEQALKIPAAGKKLFRLLVAAEEPDLFPEYSKERLRGLILEFREKSWNRSYRPLQEGESSAVHRMFSRVDLISVYAASGSPGVGATLEEIQIRTQFSERAIKDALEELLKVGIVKRSGERFETQDLHVFLQTQNVNSVLIESFQRSVQAALRRIRSNVSSQEEMFFSSTFCVDKKKLPELKKALRETVLKFIDDSIHAEGDQVVHFMTSMHL